MANLKEILTDILSADERAAVPSSYDIIGDKLIFSNFPKLLKKKQNQIGKKILEQHPHISSVFKKTKKYSGPFRIPKLTWLAGSRSKETLYKEHNTVLSFDIEKVYFSPRLGNERKRIFSQIKKPESVLCLFSGCGVYPLVILKNTKAKETLGIELNPLAHLYALKNVARNKIPTAKITLLQGDVRNILPKLKKKFDRVIMPLPKEAERFLKIALLKAKKNGIIHLYCFGSEDDVQKLQESIKVECNKQHRKCTILQTVTCGQFSPRIHRWCIDFKVN